MEDIVKIIQDLGIYACTIVVLLYLGFKYLPQYIELKLERMKEKDFMLDSFKSVIENNSQVINNNSEVIKLNSTTIKNYTDNSHKLENKIEELTTEVKNATKLLNEDSIDLKILKERGMRK